MIKDYEINEETLVVLPVDKNTTKVIETDNIYTTRSSWYYDRKNIKLWRRFSHWRY